MARSTPLRAALLDFDGTVVAEDLISLFAEFNGKRAESDRINAEFQQGKRSGIEALVERINMLAGISLTDIHNALAAKNYLMPGARELCEFFRQKGIITILASRSMVPVLQYYQHILPIDYIIGTKPTIADNKVVGMPPENIPVEGFKLLDCMAVLTELEIPVASTVAIGDSPADKGMLLHSGLGIAINPVGNVERFADHVIGKDLTEAIAIIKNHLAGSCC